MSKVFLTMVFLLVAELGYSIDPSCNLPKTAFANNRTYHCVNFQHQSVWRVSVYHNQLWVYVQAPNTGYVAEGIPVSYASPVQAFYNLAYLDQFLHVKLSADSTGKWIQMVGGLVGKGVIP